MKYFLSLLLLISTFSKIVAQSNPPPAITDIAPEFTVVYSDNAIYRYTLNTEKIDVIKPKTAYIKIVIFESDNKALLRTIYNSNETKLIDNSLMKTVITQETEETSFNVKIENDKVTLVNKGLKKKIIFRIKGYGDDLTLIDIKTNEHFENENEKKIREVPFYIK